MTDNLAQTAFGYGDLFGAGGPAIYNMPPSAPFLPHLAKGLMAALGDELHTALILLPTRRAVRDLTDAFLANTGGAPLLLPLMRPLADMDENEPPFEPGGSGLDIRPAIDSTARRFALARLSAQKMQSQTGEAPDAAAALALSEPVQSLLADMAMEGIGSHAFAKLEDALETLPKHFADAAAFIEIVSKHWPDYLDAQARAEPMARRVALLEAAAQAWIDKPPTHPVIVAGSTGTLGATARLIKTVSVMPRGLVVLPALDSHIDEQSYEQIDEQHPQASLKNLLQTLGVRRQDVPNWPGTDTKAALVMRARILAEALIPASATSDWPSRITKLESADSETTFAGGMAGLSLIEARHEEEEASCIALIMRESLETPGKTCALVTPDPSLARRVRAKLSRWDLDVDSSAGEPLEETLHGSFLSLMASAAMDPLSPRALSALFAHDLYAIEPKTRAAWQALEKHGFRGPRPRSVSALKTHLQERHERYGSDLCTDGLAALENLQATLSEFGALLAQPNPAAELARAHTALAEALAGGPARLWSGEAGEKAASVLSGLILNGHDLPHCDGPAYLRLLSQLMRGEVVRPRYGTHPRLQILGPLEARMLDADLIILGSLNDGIWPANPAPHPFLSRGMRLTIGLTAPERRYGLAAHDFAGLAAKPNVILTRAERTSDGPAVMSRWLWRLTTLARGALGDDAERALRPSQPYLDWARALDAAPTNPAAAPQPAPRPPLDARWPDGRKLSVTQIQTWVRDPYAIYAKNILGLSKLDPLDAPLGGREYGTAVHAALERYAKDGDRNSAEWLAGALREELALAGFEAHSFARHGVRLDEMAGWVVGWLESRRAQGWQLADAEKRGEAVIDGPLGGFTLSGIADRIEKRGSDNEMAILDFKTGQSPTKKVVQLGFDPQLPLLGHMLAMGGFKPVSGEAKDLLYIKPRARKLAERETSLIDKEHDAQTYLGDAYLLIENLIAHFDEESSAYYSQPRAQYVNPYGDYDQLARRAEWARLADETGNQGGGS